MIYNLLFQNKSNLEEAIREKTGSRPAWILPCNDVCSLPCTLHYNVAEIHYDDTEWERKLGSGYFGVVWKGKITLENNIR